jgi:methionyl aminopeptidase
MPPVISFHPLSMSRQYVMEVGHCFTIEPMIAQGSNEIQLWGDGWTVVTKDGSRAAQYEHMVIVTDDGAEVLTRTELCDELAF